MNAINVAATPRERGVMPYLVAVFALALSVESFAEELLPVVDLTLLAVVGDTEWRVTAAEAEAGPGTELSYLVSNEVYRDFRMSVEVWVAEQTNSGVFVRCSSRANINPNDCYEINIWDEHPQQEHRTGSVVTLAKPTAHVDTAGKWNTVQIELQGSLLVATINGVETARLQNDRSAAGYFALQFGGGGIVRLRDLRLEVLD